jgi:two-component system NtrC family response regulator
MSKIDNTQDLNTPPSLLLVEDSQEIREQMKWGLKNLYTLFEADSRENAVEILQREKIVLVTLDLGLPPDGNGASEGMKALEQLIGLNPIVKVVVITGNQDRANALKAIELGAYDFMEKPVDLDVLKTVLQRAGYLAGLEKENKKLLEREEKRGLPDIIGVSPVMAKVFDTIRRVAGSDISVLIVGESGTGKELVAKAIHQQSHRKDGP